MRIKIQFLAIPPKSAYFAGRTYEVPERMAKSYIAQGFAVHTAKPLPADFPYRDRLIEAGLDTIEAVRDEQELTSINRIGKKAETEIIDFLKNA